MMLRISEPEHHSDIRVYRNLPGEGLCDIVRQFSSAAAADPFCTWLIVPTERLVHEVIRQLSAKPLLLSRICTLDGFCSTWFDEHRTTERFISKSESKLLLTQVLKDHKKDLLLFNTRDHPSAATVDDLVTFMQVIRTRKVPFPECLLELQSEKSDELDTILSAYRDRLQEQDLVDGDTILEWTIDHISRGGASPLGTIFIYGFHEPLPLEQDVIDTLCDHAGHVVISVPDGLDPGIFRREAAGAATSGASTEPGQLSQKTAITGIFLKTGAPVAGDFFRVQTFPTRYAEMSGIAAEIRRLNSDGVPLVDIAVVFPDLRENYGLIEEVFTDYHIPWNAAVGPRLSQAPLVRFFLGIAGIAANGPSRENIVRLVASPFFCWGSGASGTTPPDAANVDLVSRYAGIDGPYPDWEKQLNRLCGELADPEKAKNFSGIPLHSAECVREGILVLLASLAALSGKRPVTDHIAAFREFLDRWMVPDRAGTPGGQLDEQERRTKKEFLSRLDSLARIAWIPADRPVTAQEFFRLVVSIGEERDDARRKDDTGVFVLGFRECPHLHFPVVFIGGLTEGVFPRLTTRLPFTNTLENARMGTRTLSEILREEQYYFIAALLSADRSVYLSAPLADGEKTLLTSAFFEQVRTGTGALPWPDVQGSAIPASRRMAATIAGARIREGNACGALDLISGSHAVSDLVDRINMEGFYRRGACDSSFDGILSGDESIREALFGRYGSGHVYSPTNLETYATCPFSYFLRRVMYLEALPEAEPDLSAANRGTVIHDILSRFYREWQSAGHRRVSLATITDATDMILNIARDELDRFLYKSPLWDATCVQMLGDKDCGPGFFERFLLCESEEEDSPLAPSRFEFSFGMEPDPSDDPASLLAPVELESPDGTRNLRIRGRIDRIDISPDGRFVIYDYKSGMQHPKAADIVAGTALQLPLYLLAFEKISGSTGIGGGYYKVRRDVARNMVLADPAVKDLMVSAVRPSADFSGTIRHACDCTFEYIDGIRAGRFPLPAKDECPNRHCNYRRICRFDPYRVFRAGKED